MYYGDTSQVDVTPYDLLDLNSYTTLRKNVFPREWVGEPSEKKFFLQRVPPGKSGKASEKKFRGVESRGRENPQISTFPIRSEFGRRRVLLSTRVLLTSKDASRRSITTGAIENP